jgi:hypothetical protein
MFLIIVCEWMRNGTFCLQAMVDEEAMDPMLHLLDVCQRSVCRQAEPLAKRPAVEVLRFCWKKNRKCLSKGMSCMQAIVDAEAVGPVRLLLDVYQ